MKVTYSITKTTNLLLNKGFYTYSQRNVVSDGVNKKKTILLWLFYKLVARPASQPVPSCTQSKLKKNAAAKIKFVNTV